MTSISRRSALQSLGLFSTPMLVPRSQAEVTSDIARFTPEVEPLVALMERTPREKCAEMMAEQLNRGVSYRQLMAALFLAGVRNVNPRPPGFALHCVFVVHAAHLISLEAPPDTRLLPLFYAMDVFKASQERDARQTAGDFVLKSASRAPAANAANSFTSSMENWDIDGAAASMSALARVRNPTAIFDMVWRYGARDYRNIGHKAIYAANAERTLRVIGWQHAEPVLRSLVMSLLDFGKEQKVNGYAFGDQTYAGNLKRISTMRMEGALIEQSDPDVTRSIVKEIRTGTPEEACAASADRLAKRNASAASIWDAAHLAAAELRMRVSGGAAITGLHAVTACNGLRHAYLTASDPAIRLLILLQAVGWMGQFRVWAEMRKENVRDFSITDMEPASEGNAGDVFAKIGQDTDEAAPDVMRLARDPRERQVFLNTVLRYTLSKADEVHYYKYQAALIEDIPLVSAEWQPHLVTAAAYYTKCPADKEPAWAKAAKAALGARA